MYVYMGGRVSVGTKLERRHWLAGETPSIHKLKLRKARFS